MGNFTQGAFFRKVGPQPRREMAAWARDALLKVGARAAEIPWPAGDDAAKGDPDLVVVAVTLLRRLEALGHELRRACDEAASAEHTPGAAAIAARARAAHDFHDAYEHVAQDLFNTIAGDLVWDHRSDSKRLGKATEALKTPIGILKNEFCALHEGDGERDAVYFATAVQMLDVALAKLDKLVARVEAAARAR